MPVLEKIVVKDFRNIALQELEFSPNVNCISGNNGTGKTNLLEAVDDLLVHEHIIQDDDFRHIVSHDGSRVYVDKENPRVEIEIKRWKQ